MNRVNIKTAVRGLLLLFLLLGTLAPRCVTAEESVSVAIVPLKINAPEGMAYLKDALRDMLSSRVGAGGDLRIIEESAIEEAMAGSGGKIGSVESRALLADTVGADFIITGSLSVIGESVSIDVQIYDAARSTSVPLAFRGDNISALIGLVDNLASRTRGIVLGGGVDIAAGEESKAVAVKAPQLRTPGTESTSPPRREEENKFIIETDRYAEQTPWMSKRFPRTFKALEIADLDGDGKNELIVIDEKFLLVFDIVEGKLSQKNEIKGGPVLKNYNIVAGDFNRNGKTEIYLTRMRASRPLSAVLEMREGALKTVSEGLPWLIGALERADQAPELVGRRFREADGFYGAVKKLGWQGDKVQERVALDLPADAGPYGFTLLDATGDGKEELLLLDDRDRLRLYARGEGGKWEQLWKSPGYYGGTLNNIEREAKDQTIEGPEKVNVKGRILTAAIGDGKEMVIINSNEPGGLGRAFKTITSYKSGEIFALAWDGAGLHELWRTKEISGFIADYRVDDLDSDGKDELILLVLQKRPGFLGKWESFVMTAPLGGRRPPPQ